MGHVLTDHGLEPDPEKIEAVIDMPTPQNVEDAQRLNGFVTYLSKFMPKLADVMKPIRRLTRIKVLSGNGQKSKRQSFRR